MTYTSSGFVNGDSYSKLSSLPVVSSTAGFHPAVGTHTGALVFSIQPTDPNYTITYVPGTLTITAEAGHISWPANTPIAYGTPLSSTQLDARAFCNGLPVTGGTWTYSPVAGTVLHAGDQPLSVTFTPPGGTVCSFTAATNSVVVNPAPLTIKANNVSIAYGSSLPTLTYAAGSPGFVNGDTFASLAVTYGYPVVGSTTGPHPGPGYYAGALQFTTEPAYADYTITWVPGNLKVTSVAGVITWAPSAPIVYGTPLSGTQLDASATCNGNPVVGGTWVYTPGSGSVLPAGTQTLTATFAPPSGIYCTYRPVSVPLTVTKAPLLVTANNKSMYAGGTVPNLTYTITGFVNGDTKSVVGGTATLTIGSISTTSPGTYLGGITFATASLTASNYNFTYVPGNFTVNADTAVITWGPLSPIAYGTPLSSMQLDAVATCNGSPVKGTYVYSPALGTVLSAGAADPLTVTFTPYNPTSCVFTPDTIYLQVNKAVLTVRAHNVNMPLGAGTLPNFTDDIYGFVLPDSLSNVVISGTATMTSSVPLSNPTAAPSGSQWPITFSTETLSATNYTFNYVPGVLTVGPPTTSAITIGFSNTNWNYPGEANVTICVTSTVSQAASGTIQLYDGNRVVAHLTLQGNGCAYWYITPGLSAGTHIFTAYYSGDGNNPAGYSPQYPITVNYATMTMEASCWNSSFAYGANYQCNANTDSGPKTGYMTYVYDGGAPVVLPLNAGGATAFTLPRPPVGTHTVIISYPTQGKYQGVTLPTNTFVVTPAIDVVSLAPSTWNPTTITDLRFTAAVASASAGTPNHIGAITFLDGANPLATVPVDGQGRCTYSTSSLAVGTHTITATYAGTNYTTTSTSISITVVAAKVAATPTFSPAAGGVFTSAQNVTLLDSTPGATIHYTTDGSTPTTSSTVYSTPIQITNGTETIKAIAAANGYSNSAVATANFDILPAAAVPVFTPGTGTYSLAAQSPAGSVSVAITSSTPSAAIYYTTDGSKPTVNSIPYTGPIGVTSSETIRAIATALQYRTSSIGAAAYTITP
jgi:hypothetical protein